MQLANFPSHLFELLILNIIESFLHALKVLLILLVGVTDEVVDGGVLRVFLSAYHPWDLKLLSE